MNLRFLAISDTHLGEDTSLLTFPQGRQHLWRTLREVFGEKKEKPEDEYNGKFIIQELILIGDIPDTALSSRSQTITHTNAFIQTLGSVANVEKCIYIPGNHDHTLWTQYRRRKKGKKPFITDSEGDLIVKDSKAQNRPASDHLLSIFCGHPYGSSWRNILADKKNLNKNFNFAIANPLYATVYSGRTYIFTHGTHFKSIVTMRKVVKQVIRYLGLDRLFVKFKVESREDVRKAKNLESLERIVTPFVDSIWNSSKNNPTSIADTLWNLFTMISAKFEERRVIPKKTLLFSYSDLRLGNGEKYKNRIKNLTGDTNKSIELFKEHFLDVMLKHLSNEKGDLLKNNLTFVYGDTHNGGCGVMQKKFKHQEIKIRIYNCGGWVVRSRNHHPACHIFAVDTNGKEYLLDISYTIEEVLGERLIKIAARDAENRTTIIANVLSSILDHIHIPNWLNKIVDKINNIYNSSNN
ncbi:hypothetical protein LCGC14_1100150 [marine sediment metagenome]|uniref:Calcineurin-like phosphoesterase domain-containing protein n=1 Tax=marine sediment metagenome TaxID=412755 RepID=A0A0F9MXL0_9ZZZZ